MKLLLVDDHELFRQGLEMLLTSQHTRNIVLHAATAAQALQQHADHPDIDLVLLDYNLGNDRGMDVLLSLKQTDPPCR